MTNKEIVSLLLKIYPLNEQDKWDNSSFINNKIELSKNVLIALDVNLQVIQYCIKNKIGLLITHHPMYIGDINEQPNKKNIKKMISLCKKNNISLLSLHTNFDKSNKGMNIGLAKKLELTSIKKNKNFYGVIGRGTIKSNIFNLCEYYQSNKEIKNLKDKIIYICGGSGSNEIELLLDDKIDIFITGEVKWHVFNNSINSDKTIIDIGHQAEKIFIDIIYDLINNNDNKIFKIYPEQLIININK